MRSSAAPDVPLLVDPPDQQHWQRLERLYFAAPTNAYYRPAICIGPAVAQISLHIRPEFHHAARVLHGSVYFKLLDDAGFFAANSIVRDVFVLTSSFTIHLLKPVVTGKLIAIGEVVSSDSRQILCDVRLRDSDSKLVGQGVGVYARSTIPLNAEMGYV